MIEEKTLVILKPDAYRRRLIGRLLRRFEDKGFQLLGLKLFRMGDKLAAAHYAAHKGKPFYEGLVRFITSGPAVFIVLGGKNVVSAVREMMGSTNAIEAAPGTIRGDCAVSNRFNLVHGSDSRQSAEKEIALFFREEELLTYEAEIDNDLYDYSEGAPI